MQQKALHDRLMGTIGDLHGIPWKIIARHIGVKESQPGRAEQIRHG